MPKSASDRRNTGNSAKPKPSRSEQSKPEQSKPKVNYRGKTVSDPNVRKVLSKVASRLEANVNVTSGDRSSVPSGGSKKSHHLQRRAADFHVSGHTDKEVFGRLRSERRQVFDRAHKYQVILHGPHTATTAPHIHIGRYKDGTGVVFLKEGMTKNSRGKYQPVKK
jgi:Peptidase M15